MLKLIQKLDVSEVAKPFCSLTLAFERRTISRQRVQLDNGMEAGLFLPRGTVLYAGDVLQAESGEQITIVAASETVSSVYCDDTLLLARACYHLGNRHIPLQINVGMLRYQHDHVLDAMLVGLGLNVQIEEASFEPEAGAYGGGHGHGHGHHHEH